MRSIAQASRGERRGHILEKKRTHGRVHEGIPERNRRMVVTATEEFQNRFEPSAISATGNGYDRYDLSTTIY